MCKNNVFIIHYDVVIMCIKYPWQNKENVTVISEIALYCVNGVSSLVYLSNKILLGQWFYQIHIILNSCLNSWPYSLP